MEHKYIIGQTGTGKSTLMKDLALEAIHQGHGVLYMEPHGSDIDDLMPRIPYSRGKDTIEFDASDETHSISWNALQVKGNQSLVVSAFTNAIKDTSLMTGMSTAKMELYIRKSLNTLIQANEPVIGLVYMLTHKPYRDRVLENVKDIYLKQFWCNFDDLPLKEQRTEVNSTYSKADTFIDDTRLRNILGQRESKLKMDEVLDGKILLVRLPQGKLGTNVVKIVGHLLLAQIHLTAMARTDTKPFYIFIDEVHTWDGGVLAEMLSGIRKYGVSITVAHQSLGQLSPLLQSSILANCNTKYIFRVSIEDALKLNQDRRPTHSVEQLYELKPYTAKIFRNLEVEEYPIEPLDWPIDKRVPELIRENTLHNYSRRATKVTKETDKFITSNDNP
jgi:hypothetical protein